MGMCRVNRPGLMIYGGSMAPNKYDGKNLDIVSAFDSYGEYISGKITDEERLNIVKNSCNSNCGSCGGFYTANTMALCLETMGMMLPYSSSNPSMSFEKIEECWSSAYYLENLLKENIIKVVLLIFKSQPFRMFRRELFVGCHGRKR